MKRKEIESFIKSFLLFFITIELLAGIIAYGYYTLKIDDEQKHLLLEMKNYSITLQGNKFSMDVVAVKPQMKPFELLQNEKQLFAYFPIPGIHQSVLKVSYSAALYEENLQRITKGLSQSFLVISMAIFLLSAGFTYYSLKPIRKLLKRMEHLATYDDLSGVMNRRLFMQMGDKYINEAERLHKDLFVLLLDIDHFKQVNDGYGHAAGDEVIKSFARRIEQNLRKSDLVGRLGGEEFGVVILTDNSDDANESAERIRRAIEQEPFVYKELQIPVTVSIGMSRYRVLDCMDSVLLRADESLYQAKEGGRNRVVRDAVLLTQTENKSHKEE